MEDQLISETPRPEKIQKRTVQEYIDETPIWSDGTESPNTPMTPMQWRIWALATAGKFFEGLVVFMTGIALPLMVEEFALSALQKGAVGAATLFGILVGATTLGGLSDYFGRKRMFIVEMAIFSLCLMLMVFSPNFLWLLVFLFGMGLALGCDYPTAHMVISESIPSKDRGKLVLSAFGFQAIGALVGTAVGYAILCGNPQVQAWRWMYATAIIPSLLVLAGRFFIPDSGHWLVSRGMVAKAEEEVGRLLKRTPRYPKKIILANPPGGAAPSHAGRSHYGMLFSRKYRRATILASVPWFLQDLATYGIGIFTPTILASVIGAKIQYAHNLADIIHNDILAAKGAAFIDLLLLVGILGAVLLADKIGRMRLQIFGFVGCAAGLFLASLSLGSGGETGVILLFVGFMTFSFMTNLGPNAMTYLIAGEVFPTHIRGKGAGFAASFAKIGAVLTAFLFPVLLADMGTAPLLYILTGTSLLGGVVTWVFSIETRGMSLEKVGHEPASSGREQPEPRRAPVGSLKPFSNPTST